MKLKYIAIVFFLYLCAIAYPIPAQTKIVDSLRAQYYTCQKSERIFLLKQLCAENHSLPVDSLQQYTSILLQLTASNKTDTNYLFAVHYLALYYNRTAKYKSIDSLLETNKNNFLHSSPLVKLKYYQIKTIIFVKSKNYKEALEIALKESALATETDNLPFQIMSNNLIGWIHMEMGQYETALQWFQKAIVPKYDTHEKYFDVVYSNIASCYGAIEKLDSCLYCINKSIEFAKKYENLSALANAYNIKSDYCIVTNAYNEAIKYNELSYNIRKVIADPFFLVSDMAQLSLLYSNMKQTDKGKKLALDALQIATKNKLESKYEFIYNSLAHNYKVEGDYKNLSDILEKINKLKDFTYASAKAEEMASLETKYETEKKDRQIEKQKFEIKNKNNLLTGLACLAILTSMLFYALYKNRKHKQELLFRQTMLQQQDIATKSVIEAEERERKRMASDLHDGLGQMLTAIKFNLNGLQSKLFIAKEDSQAYEKALLLIDESCKEVRNVSHNIMPNALLKYGLAEAVKDFIEKIENKSIQVQVHVEGLHETIENSVEIIIYRIIQEGVNNAIKHSKANKLDISIINDNDGLQITIEDNGIGFNKQILDINKGIGLRNIKTRIDYLKGIVDIDSKIGRGTLIAISIPKNTNFNNKL